MPIKIWSGETIINCRALDGDKVYLQTVLLEGEFEEQAVFKVSQPVRT